MAGATGGISMEGKTVDNKDGTFTLKLKVCNTNEHAVEIKISDNPWKTRPEGETPGVKLYDYDRKPGEKIDPKKRRNLALEHWENPQTKDGKPLKLAKKGDKGECYDFEFKYKFKPAWTYVDVFIMQPNGQIEDEYSGEYTWDWEKIETAMLFPGAPGPSRACAFYLPFMMSLDPVWDGPIQIVIDRVEGIPETHQMLSIYPPIGVPHRLEFGDRTSAGSIVLRQMALSDDEHVVKIVYKVVRPEHLRHWPHRSVCFRLQGSASYRYGEIESE